MQMLQMEGQRGRRQLEPGSDRPGIQTVRTRLDQKAIHIQPVLVRQGRKRRHRVGGFHHHFHISRIVEMMNGPDPDVKPLIRLGTSMSELRKSLVVDFQAVMSLQKQRAPAGAGARATQ